MDDLNEKIRKAKVIAGENAVIEHLKKMGLGGAIVAHVDTTQMTSVEGIDKSRPMTIEEFGILMKADVDEFVRSINENPDERHDTLDVDEWMRRYIGSVYNA